MSEVLTLKANCWALCCEDLSCCILERLHYCLMCHLARAHKRFCADFKLLGPRSRPFSVTQKRCFIFKDVLSLKAFRRMECLCWDKKVHRITFVASLKIFNLSYLTVWTFCDLINRVFLWTEARWRNWICKLPDARWSVGALERLWTAPNLMNIITSTLTLNSNKYNLSAKL